MSEVERFVATRHGRIHYREAGQGEPLLLMHSNGCSLHEYAEVLPALAAHYRCIVWDMPGHGDSEPAPGHLSVADYVEVTKGLMDALQLSRAHVGGASIGGIVAIAFGGMAPERALSVVIIEAAVRAANEWEQQWARVEASFAIPTQTLEQIAPRFRDATPALLQRWNVDRNKAGGWRMVDVMWAIRQFDAIGALGRVAVPAVVIVGENGPAVAGLSHIQQALPKASIHRLADAGHFPMIDDPAAFVAALHEGLQAVAST